MPKTILVTGCAGFIGGNFVARFHELYPQITIIGIDDCSTGRWESLHPKIKFYEGSICDEPLMERIFKKHKPDYVFHFAADPRVSSTVRNPAATTGTNIFGTVLLLEKARDHKVKRFIYSSSCAIYGDTKQLPVTEKNSLPNPISPYGLQKYAGEPFCKIFSDLYGIDTVSLRYFNVFGPGQYGGSAYATVICNWLEALYFNKKQKPFLEGDGKQSRDFCYVGDVIQANIKAMKHVKRFNGEAFNIGSGVSTNLLTIKKLIEKHTKKMLSLKKMPQRLGDVRHVYADISKAKKAFGYAPEVDFESGLRNTIDWFARRKK